MFVFGKLDQKMSFFYLNFASVFQNTLTIQTFILHPNKIKDIIIKHFFFYILNKTDNPNFSSNFSTLRIGGIGRDFLAFLLHFYYIAF